MTMLSSALDYALFVLMLVGWMFLTFEAVRAAWIGKFSYWRRKANGKVWPPVRSETPVRFWLVWAAMAGPFLVVTSMVLAGLGITLLKR